MGIRGILTMSRRKRKTKKQTRESIILSVKRVAGLNNKNNSYFTRQDLLELHELLHRKVDTNAGN